MTADEFTAAGDPGTRPQPGDTGGDRAADLAAGALRDLGQLRVDLAARYHGNDSRQALAARDRLRALDAKLVPASREVPSLSQDEMMNRLRRADPSRRRDSHTALTEQVAAGVTRQMPKTALDKLRALGAGPGARGELVPAIPELPDRGVPLSKDEMMDRLRKLR